MLYRMLTIGFLVVAGLAVVAACSSGDEETSVTSVTSSQQPSAPAAPAASDAASGTTSTPAQPVAKATAAAAVAGSAPTTVTSKPRLIRLVISNPAPSTESNNPGLDLGGTTSFQLRPMYEYLIGYDPVTGKLIPQLATSWSLEADGISFRFKLRKGIRFHGNNGEFSAQDVVYTHAQISSPDATRGTSRRLRKATVEVVNDHEVVFRNSEPNAEFLQQVSEQIAGEDIQSAADAGVLGAPSLTTRPLVGTGLYQYQDRVQAQYLRYERVPYQHWRSTADFEELEFRWVSESFTRLAGLLTEEVHITQLPEDQTQDAAREGMSVISGSLTGQRVFLGFKGAYTDASSSCGYVHCDTPFLDVRVRKALNKAINRDELNKAFFGGKGATMFMNHIPMASPAFNPDWERNFEAEYGYDPAAARALLAEAGYKHDNPLEVGVEITTHAQFSQSADILESIAAYWRDVGINASYLTIDKATNRAKTRALENTNNVGFAATSSFDIQGWRVYNSSVSSRGGTLELIDTDVVVYQIQRELDRGKQVKLLRELGDLTYPLHMSINLFWTPSELVFNPKFIASYNYPGSLSDLYTHFELVKAAG